ncbi:MAG: dTDP-4-dehydrorhamnose reductase [Cytophagales bacterium]|nr:dTDP-4-dehydrorhamnose reductase [Cytophagales bacterium]
MKFKRLSKQLPAYEFLFITKQEVDLTSESSFISYANNYQINYLINCAAYTSVDLAEKETLLATLVNESVPEMLARYCKEKAVRMIHISTDYVFDGSAHKPIAEINLPNPLSVYGRTKLNGENRVLDTLTNSYIIRTSWVYSIFGNNFVKTIINLGKQRDELNVVFDQIGTPTSAEDLAKAILSIIGSIETGIDAPGIYNYTNEGVISWYDFAVEIVRLSNLKCKVNPILSHEYPTAAKRPFFGVLDKSKIKKIFDLDIPHWADSLKKTTKYLSR